MSKFEGMTPAEREEAGKQTGVIEIRFGVEGQIKVGILFDLQELEKDELQAFAQFILMHRGTPTVMLQIISDEIERRINEDRNHHSALNN